MQAYTIAAVVLLSMLGAALSACGPTPEQLYLQDRSQCGGTGADLERCYDRAQQDYMLRSIIRERRSEALMGLGASMMMQH